MDKEIPDLYEKYCKLSEEYFKLICKKAEQELEELEKKHYG